MLKNSLKFFFLKGVLNLLTFKTIYLSHQVYRKPNLDVFSTFSWLIIQKKMQLFRNVWYSSNFVNFL